MLKILLWGEFAAAYSRSRSAAALRRFSAGANGCEVLTPGDEVTQSCSRGSLKFRTWRDGGKKEPEDSTVKFKNLEFLENRRAPEVFSFDHSVRQTHFFGVFSEV